MSELEPRKRNVLVWNENVDEVRKPGILAHYPSGIHGVLAELLHEGDNFNVRVATLDQDKAGLSDELLDWADTIVWWSHRAYDSVPLDRVEAVRQRVLSGMGLVVLHSAHFARIFKALMGTTCDLKWREAGEKERIWTIAPDHPVAMGVGEFVDIPREEMYGEPFDVPPPDQLVFVSWFKGGEVFRSGCCYVRGRGRIFYFRPGHEDYPTYHVEGVRRIIRNAAAWTAEERGKDWRVFGNSSPLENLE